MTVFKPETEAEPIRKDDHDEWSTQTKKIKKSGNSRDWERSGVEERQLAKLFIN